MVLWGFDDDRDSRRTLGERDRQILYRNANKRCQNPACNKKIEYDEMQVGHKTAWSRGGSTTLRNSVCLCYRCNKLQGTDSWAVFLKKQGHEDPKIKMKKSLEGLTVSQLKLLAQRHGVKVSGTIEEDLFSIRRLPPTKRQYINRLSGVVTEAELRSPTKEVLKPVKNKAKR